MELSTITRYESIAGELSQLDRKRRDLEQLEDDAHRFRMAKHILLHSSKGFLVGFGGRLAFSVLPLLIKSRSVARTARALASRLFGREPYLYGLFVALMLGSYNSLMAATHNMKGRAARYRGMASGLIAGLSIALLPRSSRLPFALFFLVRALEVVVRIAHRRGLLPAWEHADVATMCVSSSQVLWCWLFRPDCLNSGYRRFLNVQGGRDLRVVSLTRAFYQGTLRIGDVNKLRLDHAAPLVPVDVPKAVLHVLHPEAGTALAGFARFWLAGYRRALSVYLPVFLIPLIAFNTQRLLHAPRVSLGHALQGVARSSAFLTTYCTNCWLLVYLLERYAGVSSHWYGALAGIGGGLAVLLEKKSRRIELALYVLTHAIESFARVQQRRYELPSIPFLDGIVFAASLAVIMHAHFARPQLLRPTYRSLLRHVAGAFPKRQSITPRPHGGREEEEEEGKVAVSRRFHQPNLRLLRPPAALARSELPVLAEAAEPPSTPNSPAHSRLSFPSTMD